MIKNKTLYALFKYKLAIIILTIVGFLTGFFITNYVVNNMFSKFQLEVKVLDDSTLDNAFFISKAEEILIYNEDAKKYNSTIEDSSLKKKTV